MPMPTHIVAVGGIVENEQGNILLVKTYHGGWVFPGGQVEVDENLTEAYLDFAGKVNYMEYITNPNFELKLKTTV